MHAISVELLLLWLHCFWIGILCSFWWHLVQEGSLQRAQEAIAVLESDLKVKKFIFTLSFPKWVCPFGADHSIAYTKAENERKVALEQDKASLEAEQSELSAQYSALCNQKAALEQDLATLQSNFDTTTETLRESEQNLSAVTQNTFETWIIYNKLQNLLFDLNRRNPPLVH